MNIAEKLLAIDANTDRVEALNSELENILGGHSLPEGSVGGSSIPLQEKTINIVENGTTEVLPDGGYALSKVGVNVNVPIPSGYIKPNGEKEISENGTYEVAEFEKVTVNVPAPEGDTLTEFLKLKDGDGLFAKSQVGPTTSITLTQSELNNLVSKIPFQVLTRLPRAFNDQSRITYVPLFDTSNITNMYCMFYGCSSLTEVPLFNTSKVVDMSFMFANCAKLTEVPLFDTSKVTDMKNIFYNCKLLSTIPMFDTSKVTDMYDMFNGCTILADIPLFNTSNVTNTSSMFNGCKALTVIPAFDFRSVTSGNNTFKSLTNITEIWIKNIKTSMTVASGTSYGHLLTVDSLVHLIYELRDTGSSKTLTMGATNLAKLADVYVKLVDITDEMRAEDDLIDEKLPFVRCESTDEGAMLIADYVTLKHWALK